jgi:hypothetical protein
MPNEISARFFADFRDEIYEPWIPVGIDHSILLALSA